MGAPDSALWMEFQHLLVKALMAARKHMDRIINIVDIMRKSKLRAFSHHPKIVFKKSFFLKVPSCRVSKAARLVR